MCCYICWMVILLLLLLLLLSVCSDVRHFMMLLHASRCHGNVHRCCYGVIVSMAYGYVIDVRVSGALRVVK